jgi:hypothetical protein
VALLHTDPLTGLKRSRIRFPDGHPPTPFGCRWCGQTQRAHGYGPTHLPGHGFHAYTQPKDAQILARMRARRRVRASAAPAVHHATVAWSGSSIPDDEGDPYCADCRVDGCPRFLRIQRRHARANSTRIGGGLWGGFTSRPRNLPAGR